MFDLLRNKPVLGILLSTLPSAVLDLKQPLEIAGTIVGLAIGAITLCLKALEARQKYQQWKNSKN